MIVPLPRGLAMTVAMGHVTSGQDHMISVHQTLSPLAENPCD